MALLTGLTASDAFTSSKREGEDVCCINGSERLSQAGLVLCS